MPEYPYQILRMFVKVIENLQWDEKHITYSTNVSKSYVFLLWQACSIFLMRISEGHRSYNDGVRFPTVAVKQRNSELSIHNKQMSAGTWLLLDELTVSHLDQNYLPFTDDRLPLDLIQIQINSAHILKRYVCSAYLNISRLTLRIVFVFGIYISFIQVVCLMTGPKPLPKRALHIVRSRASSFKWEYSLLSLRSSSSFLRLLPRLPVTSIPRFIFPYLALLKAVSKQNVTNPVRLPFTYFM